MENTRKLSPTQGLRHNFAALLFLCTLVVGWLATLPSNLLMFIPNGPPDVDEVLYWHWLSKGARVAGFALLMPVVATFFHASGALLLALLLMASGAALALIEPTFGVSLAALGSGVATGALALLAVEQTARHPLKLAALMGLMAISQLLGASIGGVVVAVNWHSALVIPLILATLLLWLSRNLSPSPKARGSDRIAWLGMLWPILALLAFWQLPELEVLPPETLENPALQMALSEPHTWVMAPLMLMMVALWWRASRPWPFVVLAGLVVIATLYFSNQAPTPLFEPSALLVVLLSGSGMWIGVLLKSLSLSHLPKRHSAFWLVGLLMLPKLALLLWALALSPDLPWQGIVGVLSLG
ncbi:hypothetical protein [Ferrimonas balearica]|uniref:hypothetical protein n=1 Tax=Ferrimonas balearica TaxID=44012 RepID=UPI001C99E636|nr:hypothetical protein [Ferrimonas balearica]MBY5921746.1 hypothetical protein [Ferrimonas balearica]MBY5994914.1 hypothetical protein [Ferrimonas balearica]